MIIKISKFTAEDYLLSNKKIKTFFYSKGIWKGIEMYFLKELRNFHENKIKSFNFPNYLDYKFIFIKVFNILVEVYWEYTQTKELRFIFDEDTLNTKIDVDE